MKQTTIRKYIDILETAKKSGKCLKEFCKINGYSYNTVRNIIREAKKVPDDTKQLLSLYKEVTETDDRAEISLTRDENNKIQYYNYSIYRKNRVPLTGKLSREEMATIYRLYSYYGDSLAQRTIARHFPDLSLIDFRRILRAFNIYKSSSPFPQHMLEECTEEELRAIQLREKENSFLRKAEEDQVKNNEKLLKQYAQENIALKKKLEQAQFVVNLKNIPSYKPKLKINTLNRIINLYLSDMHIGASVTTGTLYPENINYGTDEVIRRLKVIIKNLNDLGPFDKINLILLGDNVDCAGFFGKTARLDHDMPENMDPKEQANNFISITMWFIRSLLDSFECNMSVYSVPNGNHGGSFEYVCNKALINAINATYPDIYTTLWDDFYGYMEVNNFKFILTHGKEDKFMKKPMPLNMDDKTQLMLYEWLDSKHIYGDNIHIIKGDLHSNSLSSCRKLTYRNVLSLFGASDYSNYNYSRNSYGLSYDLINNNQLIRGTFENI